MSTGYHRAERDAAEPSTPVCAPAYTTVGCPASRPWCTQGHFLSLEGVDVLVSALGVLLPEVRGVFVGGLPGEPDLARLESLGRASGLADQPLGSETGCLINSERCKHP